MDAMNTVKEKIPEEVGLDTDVSCYGIDRSFRRGSETQARIQAVDDVDIQAANRWRHVENTKGARPSFNMILGLNEPIFYAGSAQEYMEPRELANQAKSAGNILLRNLGNKGEHQAL
eukprot:8050626-Ditylum_brightwellii.AAC.1